jgi:hypothetical protein
VKSISSFVARVVFVPLALCFGAQAAHAAPYDERKAFSYLKPEHQTLLANWLTQDCRVGAEEIESHMTLAGSVLEAAIWEAYLLGPTEVERADLQNALGERYALRQRWLLQSPEAAGEFGARILEESEEDFRLTEDVKLLDRWRDAAIGGLGLVCTAASVEGLQAIARDERNPSALAAQLALERSRGCRR